MNEEVCGERQGNGTMTNDNGWRLKQNGNQRRCGTYSVIPAAEVRICS